MHSLVNLLTLFMEDFEKIIHHRDPRDLGELKMVCTWCHYKRRCHWLGMFQEVAMKCIPIKCKCKSETSVSDWRLLFCYFANHENQLQFKIQFQMYDTV